MNDVIGHIDWEYGLDYGPGSCDDNRDRPEWKGMFVLQSRVGAWRTGAREIEWFNLDLRPLSQVCLPGPCTDAWAVGTSRWAAIVERKLLIFDQHDRIECTIDQSQGEAWRLGCAVDAYTVCLVGDSGITTVDFANTKVKFEAVSKGLHGTAGVACHERGPWLALTHAGDNLAWMLRRDALSRTKCLAEGFETGETRLRLHAPRGCSFDGETLWVADSNNNRVLCLGLRDGALLRVVDQVSDERGARPMWRPIAVHPLGDGQLVVLDSKNRRIVRIDMQQRLVAKTGEEVATRRYLHLPRSVTPTASGGFLVCDSHHNRIVALRPDSRGGAFASAFYSGVTWPRHAVESGADILVIGARTAEPVRIGPTGHVDVWQPTGAALPPLKDPHQCVCDDDFGVLIVNSGAGEILAARGAATLSIREVLGRPLSDPHAADFTFEGGLIIADTGNDRLLVSDASWRQWHEVHEIALPARRLRLRQPRFVARERDLCYLVIDTGSRLVARTDFHGRGTWAFGDLEQLRPAPARSVNGDQAFNVFAWENRLFHDPRWVISPRPGQLVVSDTGNSRVVSVQLDVDKQGALQ